MFRSGISVMCVVMFQWRLDRLSAFQTRCLLRRRPARPRPFGLGLGFPVGVNAVLALITFVRDEHK